ncbi:MAG: adenosine deaminase, partial [Burkholderiaceae bacterium]|nr:adenosine deaminase [Burkholderiaceae bacterium]
RPPLDWDALLAFLAQRAIGSVESVDAHAYRRVVSLGSGERRCEGWIEVLRSRKRHTVVATLSASLAGAVPRTLAGIRRLFDLDCRPDEVARVLGALSAAHPGLRVAGAFDGFEIAVRTIVGQQVSVAAAKTIAARLATRFGAAVATPFDSLTHSFPDAGALAALDGAALAGVGLTAGRARAIVALARAVRDGGVSLRSDAPVEDTLAQLARLPGVGPWTVQMIAMRALGWPDAFPAADLGVLRALGVRSAARAEQVSQRWRPWRSYAVMHLRAGQRPAQPGAGVRTRPAAPATATAPGVSR